MKKILFLIVLSVAVTFSVLARAEQTVRREVPVGIENLQFNENSGDIYVQGRLPNVCVITPRPTLVKSKEDGVLVLTMMGRSTSDICIMGNGPRYLIVGPQYEASFDVRTLKLELIRLQLNPNETYRIVTANGVSAFDVDFSQVETLGKVLGGVFAVENGGTPSNEEYSIFVR